MPRLLRAVLLVGAVVLAALAAVFAWNEWDKSHYARVQGQIVSITESCEVSRRRASGSGTRRTQEAIVEESCSSVRSSYGGGHDFEEMRSINYRYTSPVDGQIYPGMFHWRPSSAEGRQPGQPIEVLAHKTEPGRSRHP